MPTCWAPGVVAEMCILIIKHMLVVVVVEVCCAQVLQAIERRLHSLVLWVAIWVEVEDLDAQHCCCVPHHKEAQEDYACHGVWHERAPYLANALLPGGNALNLDDLNRFVEECFCFHLVQPPGLLLRLPLLKHGVDRQLRTTQQRQLRATEELWGMGEYGARAWLYMCASQLSKSWRRFNPKPRVF